VKKDSTFLDKQYTNFGQVTDGMNVATSIKIGDKIKRVTVE
jgi:cyclophilin family peptidyl-prolyl cis-trans isomerase